MKKLSILDRNNLGKQRRLLAGIKDDIRYMSKLQLGSPANIKVEGEIMASWIISLLENIHLYPDWFKKDVLPEKS